MRVTSVTFEYPPGPTSGKIPTAASVGLYPSLLARLFGCRPRVVGLRNVRADTRPLWVGHATGKPLSELPHGKLIEDALDRGFSGGSPFVGRRLLKDES